MSESKFQEIPRTTVRQSDVSVGSVTRCYCGVRMGFPHAVTELWGRLFSRLRRQAQRQVRRAPFPVRDADAEQVAVDAFHSMVRQARVGKDAWIQDRQQLWVLLLTIVRRKLSSGSRSKPKPVKWTGMESVDTNAPHADDDRWLREEVEHLLTKLPSHSTRQVFICRLLGKNQAETAAFLGISTRAVRRKMLIIRDVFRDTQEDEA